MLNVTKIQCTKCHHITFCNQGMAPIISIRCSVCKKNSPPQSYFNRGNMYYGAVECWCCGEVQKWKKKGEASEVCEMLADESWRNVGWGSNEWYIRKRINERMLGRGNEMLVGEGEFMELDEVVLAPQKGRVWRLRIRDCLEV